MIDALLSGALNDCEIIKENIKYYENIKENIKELTIEPSSLKRTTL